MGMKYSTICERRVALVRPMTSDGAIQWDIFRKELIDSHIEQGSDGLVITGSTEMTGTTSTDDHIELMQVSVEHSAGRIPIVGGTGTNSTRKAVEQTSAAWKVGVATCLSVLPHHNKPTQVGIYQNFHAMLKVVDGAVILCDVPGPTISSMTVKTILAKWEVSRVVALKDATGDTGCANELFYQLPVSFSIYSDEAGIWRHSPGPRFDLIDPPPTRRSPASP